VPKNHKFRNDEALEGKPQSDTVPRAGARSRGEKPERIAE